MNFPTESIDTSFGSNAIPSKADGQKPEADHGEKREAFEAALDAATPSPRRQPSMPKRHASSSTASTEADAATATPKETDQGAPAAATRSTKSDDDEEEPAGVPGIGLAIIPVAVALAMAKADAAQAREAVHPSDTPTAAVVAPAGPVAADRPSVTLPSSLLSEISQQAEQVAAPAGDDLRSVAAKEAHPLLVDVDVANAIHSTKALAGEHGATVKWEDAPILPAPPALEAERAAPPIEVGGRERTADRAEKKTDGTTPAIADRSSPVDLRATLPSAGVESAIAMAHTMAGLSGQIVARTALVERPMTTATATPSTTATSRTTARATPTSTPMATSTTTSTSTATATATSTPTATSTSTSTSEAGDAAAPIDERGAPPVRSSQDGASIPLAQASTTDETSPTATPTPTDAAAALKATEEQPARKRQLTEPGAVAVHSAAIEQRQATAPVERASSTAAHRSVNGDEASELRQTHAEVAVSRMTLRSGVKAEAWIPDMGRIGLETRASHEGLSLHVATEHAEAAATMNAYRPEIRAEIERSGVSLTDFSIGGGGVGAGSNGSGTRDGERPRHQGASSTGESNDVSTAVEQVRAARPGRVRIVL